jgi:hypothetical protein
MDLMRGRKIEKWDLGHKGFIENEDQKFTDFPFTSNQLPVYSNRLRDVVEKFS